VSEAIPVPEETFIVSEALADRIDMSQFDDEISPVLHIAGTLHFTNADFPCTLRFIQVKGEKPTKIIVSVENANVINTILTDTFQSIGIELEDSEVKMYDCQGPVSISTEVSGRSVLLEIGFPPDSLIITD